MTQRFSFSNDINIVPLCNAKWDPKINNYRKASSIEKIRCCLNQCENHIKYCYEKGYPNCDNLVETCEDGCYKIPSEGLRIVCDCAELSKCGTYPNYDPECITKHESDIINCCKRKCPSYECVDENSCSDYIDFIKTGIRSPLTNLKKSKIQTTNLSIPSDKKSNNISYIYLVIGLFTLAIFILLKLKNKRKKRKG